MNKKTLVSEFPAIELPNPDSPVEWWFFNGRFEDKTIGQRVFMISFFRHNLADEGAEPHHGYLLLFSILNPETGDYKTTSLIDNPVLQRSIRLLENEPAGHELDNDFIKVYLSELKKYGPPFPIIVSEAEGEFSDEHIKIFWDDFQLEQTNGEFRIVFPDETGDVKKQCTLILTQETDRFTFEIPDSSNTEDGKVPYHCYPRLSLTGAVGDTPVSGQAWMDHQWGTAGWFVSKQKPDTLLGWDWFGINLDDGTDFILFFLKDAKTGHSINSSCVLFDPYKGVTYLENFEATPFEFWESPATHIRYPTGWNLFIRDLDLKLRFTPLAQNQEVPVFGLGRSMWEGEGTVSGTMGGSVTTGRARGEFTGYGYIFDFKKYLTQLADRVDQRIEEFFPKKMDDSVLETYVGKPFWKNEPDAHTEMISRPVWDLILRRGKRWRPIFGILMQEALGGSSVQYERSWCLAELIHSGALIIDDIEDDSELRRGEPTLHKKYGLDVAINAGNLLYFLPTVELFNHKFLTDSQKLRIHEIMMDTCLKGHFGQTLDIYWSNRMSAENLSVWLKDDIEAKILQMYDYKTAAGPKGLVRVAAVLNNLTDEKTIEAAISFARAFAVGFQIIDDVHNFSSSPKWTKKRGEDIANGKLTYVIAKALTLLEGKRKNKLIHILGSKEIRQQETALNDAIEMVISSEALEACKKEARDMSTRAWEHFADVVAVSEAKMMLHMLHLKMLDLAFDT